MAQKILKLFSISIIFLIGSLSYSVSAVEMKMGTFRAPDAYTWTEYRFDVNGGVFEGFNSHLQGNYTAVWNLIGDPRPVYSDYDFYSGIFSDACWASPKVCPTYRNVWMNSNTVSFVMYDPSYFYRYSWGTLQYVSINLIAAYEATVSDGATISISEIRSGVVGVPEPAIWAQLIIGLGLTGAAFRNRRRVTSARIRLDAL